MTSNESYPYVALSAQTTGIHPSTGRILTIDAVTFDDGGRVGEEFHAVINPGCDPGPRHTHGLSTHEVAQAPRFTRFLKSLDKLLDDRVLVTFDTPTTWGFIVSEARRAMSAAARANRSRKKRNGRRRQRVGHVPHPTQIVDLLAAARRQGVVPTDLRIGAIADLIGVASESPVANAERAARPEAEISREQTLKLVAMYMQLREHGEVPGRAPDELAADRFGLQRSTVRVDAEKAGAAADNPGKYSRETGLRKGMEVVITDDIALEPDTLIDAAVRAGLTYTEKLTRESSVVVTDALARGASPDELRGKAMHGHRKDIPLLTGEEFLTAVEQMGSAERVH